MQLELTDALYENGRGMTGSLNKGEILSSYFQQVFTWEDLSPIPSKDCSVFAQPGSNGQTKVSWYQGQSIGMD